MLLKNKTALKMYETIDQLPTIDNFAVAFAFTLNKRKLQPIVDSINEINKVDDKYIDYERARIQLCSDHSEKDATGNPVMDENNRFKILPEKIEDFTAKAAELQTEYQEYISKEMERPQKVIALMDHEVEVDLQKIKLADLSALKGVSPKAIDAIFDLIEQ